MKIGILTYHASHNYGAFLQAYALRNVLIEKTGNDVDIINFNMPQSVELYANMSNPETDNEQEKKFCQDRGRMFVEQSLKYHDLKGECFVSDDLNQFSDWIQGKYDIVIVGSDEIWYMRGFRGFPTPYWLPGVTGCRKMAYAASARVDQNDMTKEEQSQVKKFLEDFSYISVRDNVTRRMVEIATGRSPQVTCDPTFAYEFHINKELGKWLIKNKYRYNGRKKCIGLMLTNGKLIDAIVRKYDRDFDFISLYAYNKNIKSNVVLTPFEWTQVIAGCDGLITSFFHGMVFALKGNTPFISFETRKIKSDEYSKAYDLLKRHGLEGHYSRLVNIEEQSLRIVGPFLADVLTDKAKHDFSDICEKERQSFFSFLEQLPSNCPNHIVVNKDTQCCGCSACVDTCPEKAIKLEIDEKGFWYPKVDEEKCLFCGKCIDACTFHYRLSNEGRGVPSSVYAVKHKDENVRLLSRSGGIFTAITDNVLEHGGCIYGAAFADGFQVEHKRATTVEERNAFRTSKYVQSDMTGVYDQIKCDLRAGYPILFSGTPCQVAAVRNAMQNEDCSGLYLIDILCFGVPSPKVWRDYLNCRQNEYDGRITAVEFRDKQFGWKAHRETFIINGLKYDSDDYTKLFSSRDILRPSCFECPYKSTERTGDITIADFWGIDNAVPGFNDDKGVSLVMVNTEKGEKLFEESKKDIICENSNLEDAMQNSMRFSYPRPDSYFEFWDNYEEFGMDGYLQKRKQMREDIKRKQEEERIRKLQEEETQRKHQVKQRVKQRIKSVLGNIWRITVGD